MSDIRDQSFDKFDALALYALLRLRVDVFVVEQECPYPELDGRDLEPTTRHVWIDEGGMPVACLRLLAEPDGSHRISRVATAADQRHQGLAGLLVDHVMATTPGRLVLDAQTYLEPWYVEHGFARTGDEFTDDGIPHVPMERG
ncbi:MAG: GNAT family N-acetyltransferase [Actinomycetota bacterium]|nr:GNAT family N-acetyltransferase [Actinomycetota bacterium]MED5584439.1 GNAT family N-acetyltransferase [Actinomycetota bacterium]MEE3115516.1 GNAT family N-acetyltransferase [Actinomycetota bacterium]